ncbi:Uncharacterised protein [Vibrio cholerae]|nr:Uncharacterised protein [Vibrio cholerae]
MTISAANSSAALIGHKPMITGSEPSSIADLVALSARK